MRISDGSSDVCSSGLTRRDVSTGQLVRIPGAGGPRQIIPMPKGYVLSGLAATQDGLYVLGLRDGASHLFWLPGVKGEAREIRLPFEAAIRSFAATADGSAVTRSEEHTSELQSLMRISYAVFCLKKKNILKTSIIYRQNTIQNNL